jgi:hypothetical protein
MEVTISKSNYTFVDVSNWLDQLDRVYDNAKASMWHFAATLAAGIDQFGRTDPRKRELYEMASNQLGLTIGTLQTYVSAVRSPVANLAIEKDLSFQHARAVLGLAPEVADDLLDQAVANGWAPEKLGHEAWAKKNGLPSQRTLNSAPAAYEATEIDDVPFSHADQPDDSATYDSLWSDERISSMVDTLRNFEHTDTDGDTWRTVLADDVCRLLRTMRDEYEIMLWRIKL